MTIDFGLSSCHPWAWDFTIFNIWAACSCVLIFSPTCHRCLLVSRLSSTFSLSFLSDCLSFTSSTHCTIPSSVCGALLAGCLWPVPSAPCFPRSLGVCYLPAALATALCCQPEHEHECRVSMFLKCSPSFPNSISTFMHSFTQTPNMQCSKERTSDTCYSSKEFSHAFHTFKVLPVI